jgi:HTH-type transcriptional regulator/antitoxin HigA
MEETMANTQVEQVFPPGEILREELEARGWSQLDLAEILGRPAKLVNELVGGRRAITPETAQGLADALGTSPELWMNLESQYQLYKARRVDPSVVRRAELFAIAPVKEMQRRGWIAETKDIEALEKSVCAFFDAPSLHNIQTLPCAAKKSTSYNESATPAQNAWVQRVRLLGHSVAAARFTPESFKRTLQRLRALLRSRAEVRHVPKVLAEGGIRLVVVEHLAGTRIDGVCVWLTPNEPVIGLSLRYDRIDSFWFALAHELGHILAGDGKNCPIVDLDLVGDAAMKSAEKPPQEQAADAFASDFLVPTAEMSGFIARVKPLYSKQTIKGFAARLGIHPGIVVGQLAFMGQIGFWHSREMLEKVRDIIRSTALVDGWNQATA